MGIKKEYINETKKKIESLHKEFIRKFILLDEIKILELENKNFIGNINFDELGYKTKHSYKGIDDLVINGQDKLFNKKCEVEFIEKKLSELDLYLNRLDSFDSNLIRLRFFTNKTRKMKHLEIAFEVNCSLATVSRRIEESIKQITYFINGTESEV